VIALGEAKFHTGIKALITNENGEILLLKSGPAEEKHTKVEFWDFPGGRIKEGCDIEDTLRREVEEELGVRGDELKIGDIFGATISNFKASHGEDISLMLIVYKCELSGNREFVLSEEHSEWKYVSVEDAKRLLSVKFPASFIKRLDELKTNV